MYRDTFHRWRPDAQKFMGEWFAQGDVDMRITLDQAIKILRTLIVLPRTEVHSGSGTGRNDDQFSPKWCKLYAAIYENKADLSFMDE